MKNSEKIIYLLWSPEGQLGEERQKILLKECAGEIIDAGAANLVIYINDSDSDVKSPAPFRGSEKPFTAQVEVWIKDLAISRAVEGILNDKGFALAGYRVQESIYREYGGNMYMHQRDWADGKRSPGLVSVNLLKRPDRISTEDWIKRWHNIMSPVSEAIQPRARYVRNLVLESITPDAPPYNGIVIEVWPSKRHVTNKFLFFGADNIFQLIVNMIKILKAVKSFLRIKDIRTVMMSEYFIKTDF